MVKLMCAATVKIAIAAAVATVLYAQTDADRERRLADLERKIRQLDPAFTPGSLTVQGLPLAVLRRAGLR